MAKNHLAKCCGINAVAKNDCAEGFFSASIGMQQAAAAATLGQQSPVRTVRGQWRAPLRIIF